MNEKVFKAFIAWLVCAIVCTGAACASTDGIAEQPNKNPHSAVWLDADMIRSLDSIQRVDADGYLYEMTVYEDYRNNGILTKINEEIFHGCTAFHAYNDDGDAITCRNYDCKHGVFDKDGKKTGEYSGVNILVRCHPEGKYSSIGMADALGIINGMPEARVGMPDDGMTDISELAKIPFYTMDGMNEKGLFVCVNKLDLKEGEKPLRQNAEGKLSITHTQLIRFLLDDCATVEEAIAHASDFNICVYQNCDLHLFVSDAAGKAVILEWRYGNLTADEADAATNFYLSYDDAEEGTPKLEGFEKNFSYGYGHGYERFNTVVSTLQRYKNENNVAVLTEKQAKAILMNVAQDVGTRDTTQTQYSGIYNQTKRSLTLWSYMDYDHRYEFRIQEN